MDGSEHALLIVGLGNPGSRYAQTRHNLGFRVVDALIARSGRSRVPAKGSHLMKIELDQREVYCLKPDNFMNRSGAAVLGAMTSLRIAPAEMLVVYDDLDLKVGRIRFRPDGGSGGHRGVADIIRAIGANFCRLRLGIGRPLPEQPVEDYVLERFRPEELEEIECAIVMATAGCAHWLEHGIQSAMNNFNGDADEKSAEPRENGNRP